MACSKAAARIASSRPVTTNEPTMMIIWLWKERAFLISPFCWALYEAHCSEVQAMGATSRVAMKLKGGLRSMLLALAAASAVW